MRAMILEGVHRLPEDRHPLRWAERPDPDPGPGEVVLEVEACGVCHTELDEIEGRASPASFPRIPGHQVVGRVVGAGAGVAGLDEGARVGVAWIFSACGSCRFCRAGRENLCPEFRGTGCDADGGYAELMLAPAAFVHPLPAGLSSVAAAPLLCAGAIGWRSLTLAGIEDGASLGLTGFGASGHLVLQIVRHRLPATEVFVFARSEAERELALELGASWVGDTAARPPRLLDAIIDTTPAWRPVVEALASLAPGGRLVINAIRKEAGDQEALLEVDYPRHLWLEKEIKSVANVTREDVRALLEEAGTMRLAPEVTTFPLEEANRALLELKEGKIRGAKVLVVGR